MKIKVILLAGNFTIITMFYVWGGFAGRRSGRTGNSGYRSPLYPLVPVAGIIIVIGEVIAQWLDKDAGRPSLFVWIGTYALAFLYYRFVLMRRAVPWRMVGPADIDAQARA